MTDLDNTEGGHELFNQLADLFLEMGVFVSPSECHGLLCGQLAQTKALSESGWLRNVASYLEQLKIDQGKVKETLTELYRQARSQLQAPGFELELVLPDDDSGLKQRAESVGLWCQGFLAGFGNSQVAKLSEEARESLRDFAEIAQIERDDLGVSEENERDLVQVIEYVRMVAILIYSELIDNETTQVQTEALLRPANKPPPSLH